MRFRNIKNVLDKKYDTLELEGIWKELLGQPEANGLWLISGYEKMGKTTFALIMAEMLGKNKKVGYVIAEQGFDKDFQELLIRLSIGFNKDLKFMEYIPIDELDYVLKKKNQPDIIFLDNLTVYVDELKGGRLLKFIKSNPRKLIILMAHKEKGEVKYATGKLAKRLAKRVIDVEGNIATVDGRTEGGSIIINKEKAELYHGSDINQKSN